MATPLEPRWVLVAWTTCLASCATYGSDLVGAPLDGQAGSAQSGAASGAAGSAGAGGAGSGGVAAGSAGTPPEAGAPDELPTTPYLMAKIDAAPASVVLTEQGTLDWAHWGLKDASDYNHKANVTSHLLDFKPVGGAAPMQLVDAAVQLIWSDGTPLGSTTTSTAITWQGLDEGFELVVPAIVEPRRLRLYLGVMAGTGRIKAQLSDARATTKVDTPLVSPKQEWVSQVVSLEYGGADKAGTTLGVTFSVEATISPQAAVSIAAIAIDEP